MVDGKIQQVALPADLCSSEEVTVERSLAKSAGEVGSTHRRRTGKNVYFNECFPLDALIVLYTCIDRFENCIVY